MEPTHDPQNTEVGSFNARWINTCFDVGYISTAAGRYHPSICTPEYMRYANTYASYRIDLTCMELNRCICMRSQYNVMMIPRLLPSFNSLDNTPRHVEAGGLDDIKEMQVGRVRYLTGLGWQVLEAARASTVPRYALAGSHLTTDAVRLCRYTMIVAP